MSYGITSKSQIIDYDTIRKACDNLKAISKDFNVCGEKIRKSGDDCGINVLSVDNRTMQPGIWDLGDSIQKIQTKYENLAESITNSAYKIKLQQEAELEEYLKKQEDK